MESTNNPAYELHQQIRNSEGERLYWKMKELRASYYVFASNHQQLLQAIQYYETDESARNFSMDKEARVERFQMENLRLLHNFLAGASTLMDHTRVLINELYVGKEFRAEYQKKVDEVFAGSSIAGFVKRLRNWQTHCGLVPLLWQATLDDAASEKITLSVQLSLEALRAWDGWDKRAKEFLAAARPPLRLCNVVQEYHDLVKQFYSWLESRMLEIHRTAFDERTALLERYRDLMSADSPRSHQS